MLSQILSLLILEPTRCLPFQSPSQASSPLLLPSGYTLPTCTSKGGWRSELVPVPFLLGSETQFGSLVESTGSKSEPLHSNYPLASYSSTELSQFPWTKRDNDIPVFLGYCRPSGEHAHGAISRASDQQRGLSTQGPILGLHACARGRTRTRMRAEG